MAQQFVKEVKTELGYIVRSSDEEIVGTWLWKDGSMTVSSTKRDVREVLSRGTILEKEQLLNGKVRFSYSTENVYVTRFTPTELSSFLAPTYYCITDKERRAKTVILPENTGHHSATFAQVFRGYVIEKLRNRDITIGVWFYTPQGIVCETSSRSFNRAFEDVKKKLRRIKFTSEGVREVPLPFKEANYFDINLKLPERFFLVPSWGIEGELR